SSLFFVQAEDGIRDLTVTGVQTCALPIFIRVYSGQLKTGDSVLNTTRTRSERIGRLLKMHANKREEISEIFAGDICACVGLKNEIGRASCRERVKSSVVSASV